MLNRHIFATLDEQEQKLRPENPPENKRTQDPYPFQMYLGDMD